LILSREEAICLVLGLSERNEVNSITKLNKLLARLNLHMIPVAIDFKLNKYGSFSADLGGLHSNAFFEVKPYTYKEGLGQKIIIKAEGRELFAQTKKKIESFFDEKEFSDLQTEIRSLSLLDARNISANEHQELLVDVEDRFKLEQTLNVINADMYDLYDERKHLSDKIIVEIKLRALIEYCYFLAKYLKDVRFKQIVASDEYDFAANMLDYYYISVLHNKIIPFLNEEIKSEKKSLRRINKIYQYVVSYATTNDYPFSLENVSLKDLLLRCQ